MDANTDVGFASCPVIYDGEDDTVFDVIGDDCLCAGVLAVYGCTDADACNYDELANVDDETCYYLGTGNITGPLFPFAGNTSTYTYNGAVGDGFAWTVQGGDIVSGQGTNQITVVWGDNAGGGVVSVLESDNSGCEGEVVRTVQILATTAVSEASKLDFQVMPNPARDVLWISMEESGVGLINARLFDVQGALIQEIQTNGRFDVSGLAPGMYSLQISTDFGRGTKTFVVE